jgi:hypothetical protein
MAWEPFLLYILRNILYHMKCQVPSDTLKCCHLEHGFTVWHSPLFVLHFRSMDSAFLIGFIMRSGQDLEGLRSAERSGGKTDCDLI